MKTLALALVVVLVVAFIAAPAFAGKRHVCLFTSVGLFDLYMVDAGPGVYRLDGTLRLIGAVPVTGTAFLDGGEVSGGLTILTTSPSVYTFSIGVHELTGRGTTVGLTELETRVATTLEVFPCP